MMGQGGGWEFLIERIGVGVGMIGQGGGRRFAVMPAKVCAIAIFISIFVGIFV
jgi:hypothetical protein